MRPCDLVLAVALGLALWVLVLELVVLGARLALGAL